MNRSLPPMLDRTIAVRAGVWSCFFPDLSLKMIY